MQKFLEGTVFGLAISFIIWLFTSAIFIKPDEGTLVLQYERCKASYEDAKEQFKDYRTEDGGEVYLNMGRVQWSARCAMETLDDLNLYYKMNFIERQ